MKRAGWMGMRSNVPAKTRSKVMVIALLEGNQWTDEERREIEAALNRPKELERYVRRSE